MRYLFLALLLFGCATPAQGPRIDLSGTLQEVKEDARRHCGGPGTIVRPKLREVCCLRDGEVSCEPF